MLRGAATVILTVLVGVAIGYGMAEWQRTSSIQGAVDKARLAGLVSGGNCDPDGVAESLEVAVFKKVVPDVEVESDEQVPCSFSFWVGDNSFLQGWGVVRRDSSARVDLYSRLDTDLLESSRPTFSIIFYGKQRPEFAIDTLENRLFRISEDPSLEVLVVAPWAVSGIN